MSLRPSKSTGAASLVKVSCFDLLQTSLTTYQIPIDWQLIFTSLSSLDLCSFGQGRGGCLSIHFQAPTSKQLEVYLMQETFRGESEANPRSSPFELRSSEVIHHSLANKQQTFNFLHSEGACSYPSWLHVLLSVHPETHTKYRFRSYKWTKPYRRAIGTKWISYHIDWSNRSVSSQKSW